LPRSLGMDRESVPFRAADAGQYQRWNEKAGPRRDALSSQRYALEVQKGDRP